MFTRKFRAWDYESKQWLYDFAFSAKHGVVVMIPDNWEGSQDAATFDVTVSTGMVDKKGKEIFEGDAVVHVAYPDQPSVVRYDTYQFEALDADGDNILGYVASQIDIVGNVFENPELKKYLTK